jgi:hypothetical protein
MDRVRFGRALGYGARHAAKAVAKAVDAATAPNPAQPARAAGGQPEAAAQKPATAQKPTATQTGATTPESFARTPAQNGRGSGAERLTQAHVVARHGRDQAAHLRRHMWSPLARFSSVVWLQVTGTFFALLAAFLSQGLWKERGAMRLPVNSPAAGTFYLHAAAFAIFVYFAVSSFVRAHLRQRR